LNAPRIGEMKPGMSLKEATVANLGLVVNVLAWGSFFPVLDLLLKRWDVLSATAARQTVAIVALLVILAAIERRWPLRRGLPWGAVTLLGFVGITLCSLLTTLGVYLASALSAAIIWAANPIISALVARALYGVPLTRAILAGAVLSVAGGILAIVAGHGGRFGFGIGELSIIAANVLWTWFSLAIQEKLAAYSQLERYAYAQLPGTLILIAAVAAANLLGLTEIRMELSPWALAYILYLGCIPLALGNFLWLWGVSRIGVNVASMYQNLISVTAVLVTIWIGIYPNWQQLIGGGIILAGVLYTQIAERRRRARAANPAVSP
jgi:drug/metabolite transporter (DMT)-like permease